MIVTVPNCVPTSIWANRVCLGYEMECLTECGVIVLVCTSGLLYNRDSLLPRTKQRYQLVM